MIRKVVAAVLVLSLVPCGIYSAETDNAASLPGENKSSPSSGASYFQGVWAGSWPGYADSSNSQDISIKVGTEIKEKTFEVLYSWDAVEWKKGPVPAGKVKTEGVEQDDKLVFQYENKQGKKFAVTLQKHKENVVKGRIEKEGPTGPKERPYNETYLERK